MLDCSAPIHSPLGHGFFFYHSPSLLSLSSKPFNPQHLFSNFPLPCKTHKPCLRLSLSTIDLQNPLSSTDYLVTSLSLSHELAIEIEKSKPIDLKSSSNADSVLALFRDYGFSDTHMATVFAVRPELLSYDPHRVLKPKFDFFAQNAISGNALVDVLTSDPNILRRNLRKIMVPCFDFLRAFFGPESAEAIPSIFSRHGGASILRHFSAATAPNAEALRSFGVPDANMVKLFRTQAMFLSRDVDKFHELLRDVKEVGFDPQTMMFIQGLRVFSTVRKDKRVSHMAVLRSDFGLTHAQVRDLIVKQPTFLRLSEKRLKQVMEFFLNRLDWNPDYIVKYPSVLSFNLDDRIIRRLSVVEILISKGLEKKTCMGVAFRDPEDIFLKRFVERHQQEVPQLLELYQENMGNSKSLKLRLSEAETIS